jgi:hypothetical protein
VLFGFVLKGVGDGSAIWSAMEVAVGAVKKADGFGEFGIVDCMGVSL